MAHKTKQDGWMELTLCTLNESMLAPRRERVEQLTTGEISHSTGNNANLPPSVAREGGQGHYQEFV